MNVLRHGMLSKDVGHQTTTQLPLGAGYSRKKPSSWGHTDDLVCDVRDHGHHTDDHRKFHHSGSPIRTRVAIHWSGWRGDEYPSHVRARAEPSDARPVYCLRFGRSRTPLSTTAP